MNVSLVNYRKGMCQITRQSTNCVDVKSTELDIPPITVSVKKLPELITNIAFQTKLKLASKGDFQKGEQ